MLFYPQEVMVLFVDYDFAMTPTRVITSYRLLTSPVGVIHRRKYRNCWGIALKAGGQTCYRQGQRQLLSDKNHVILLPKGAEYEWTCTEPGECIIIDFEALETDRTIRSVEINDESFILASFAKMEKCLTLEHPAGRLEAMQLLYGILLFLAKSANTLYVPKTKQKVLAPAMDHILENYADPGICNDRLAALCGISTVYFRKTFESVYGTSPIRYLHELRINKAKSILSGDYSSIGQVAQSVGYSSVYHFSKMFRLYTGVSPSSYAGNAEK